MNNEEAIKQYLSERARKAGSVMTDKKRKAILRNLAMGRKTRWKNGKAKPKKKANENNQPKTDDIRIVHAAEGPQ